MFEVRIVFNTDLGMEDFHLKLKELLDKGKAYNDKDFIFDRICDEFTIMEVKRG